MHRIYPALLILLTVASVNAEDILPQGWRTEDNTLVHEQSGARCPAEIDGLVRKGITSGGTPDLGVCAYAGENDREGLIRVRQYVRGQGETPLAIQNDETLMEPQSGSRIPTMSMRSGPGPEKNGIASRQMVLTIARNGILIDCIGRQLASSQGDTSFEFAIKCKQAQPEKK